MAAKRYRLEVWDRTNTARQAVFRTVLSATRRQVLKGEETATFDVPLTDPAAALLAAGSVLRLQEAGNATGVSLWRLSAHGKERGGDGALRLRIHADALWMDFRHGLVRQAQASGRALFTFGLVGLTPTAWLQDFVLAGYDGDAITFQLGTVEPADPVDLAFDRATPLAALRLLEEAVPGGAEAQFRLAADGSFYHVDLLARVGRTSGGAELRYGKNVRGLERAEDEADVQTRLYAEGGGLLTLADAEWTVAGVAGVAGARVLTFQGAHPVFEDDAFVGLFFYIEGKGAYPVDASDATAGTLTVDDGVLPALAADDVGRLATDGAGSPLAYLESPSARAAYGVRIGLLTAGDVPDARNDVPNGDLALETAGLPTNWSATGAPVVAKTTDPLYARQGGAAWNVQAAADGEGLLSDPFPLSLPSDRPYTALLAGLTVVSGKVRVELVHEDGTTYPVSARPSSEGTGIYLELKAGPVHDEPLPAGDAHVRVVAHGGAAEWVLDCAMVTPTAGNEVPPFVAASGALLLWDRAAAELADRRSPALEVRVDVADLYQADPARFPFDELLLGDDVKLRDLDLGQETVRIVELAQDVLRAEATGVVLAASVRRRITDPTRPPLLPLGGARAGSATGGLAQPAAAVLSHAPQFDATDGNLYLGALGNARTATLELYTKTTRAGAYPGAPTATINGRQGTFAGQPVAERAVLYYLIVPKDGRGVAGEAVEDAFSRSDASAPTVEPRVQLAADQASADVYAKVASPTAELMRLHVKDSDGAGAAVWSLVQANGDPAVRTVASGTELGPADWFHDGSSYAQILGGQALTRDQVRRIFVQAEGASSAFRSSWIPVPLELKGQPWLESLSARWDEAADAIPATAIGGAHCQSARWEWSDDDFASVAHQVDAALADGQKVTQTHALAAVDRGKEWKVRVVPYNGPYTGGVATGLVGAPHEEAVPVPAGESGAGIAPPTASAEVVSETTDQITVQIAGAAGAGAAGPIDYRYRVSIRGSVGGWGPGAGDGWAQLTAADSGSVNVAIDRDPKHGATLWAEIRDAAGRVTKAAPVLIAQELDAIDEGTGRIRRGEPFDDGDHGARAVDTLGEELHGNVRDSRGESLNTMFGKAVDDADDVSDGLSKTFVNPGYVDGSRRPTTLRRALSDLPADDAVAEGESLSRLGERWASHLQRSSGDGTAISTIIQHLANTGHAASSMQDSRAQALNSLFAKSVDDGDDVAEGLSNKWAAESGAEVTTGKSLAILSNRYAGNLQRSSGDGTAISTIIQHLANTGHAASSMQDSRAQALNSLFAKSVDDGDDVAEGLTNKWAAESGAEVTTGKSLAILSNRYASNLQRSSGDGTAVSTIVQYLTNGGHAASSMQDSRAQALNSMFAKSVDDLDDAPDGLTYKRTTTSQRDGGGRAHSNINSSLEYTGDQFVATSPVFTGNPQWFGHLEGIAGASRLSVQDGVFEFGPNSDVFARCTKGGDLDLKFLEFVQGSVTWSIFLDGNPWPLKFRYKSSNRFQFLNNGDGEADVGWSTFSPHPPKDEAKMTPQDWLDWAMEDAGKPNKPYSGLPDLANPEVVLMAFDERRPEAEVIQRERAMYRKDMAKIAIGVARWAEALRNAIRDAADLDDLKLRMGV